MPTTVENNPVPEKKQEEWSNRYIAIGVTACVGGLIFQLITGSLYQWGIINIYVTSYFKTLDSSVTLEANAIAFPIMMFCMGLPMRLGIYLAEITHPMFMLITCQVLLSLSIFVSSYMTSMWVFIFFYGILFGLLVGSAFMIPIIECNKYFPGKKNYVNGTILIGTGSGSVVFGMFSYSYLNPNQLKPLLGYYFGAPELQEIALRVPTLLKFLALMYLVFGLVGIAMMSPVIMGNRRKENQKLEQEKAKKQEDERNGIVVDTAQVQQAQQVNLMNDHEAHSLKEAFCSWICWIEVVIVLLVSTGLYLINGNYKTYVKKTINDDYFLTIIGAIGAIANGCSRFVWNLFFLKTGYKTVMLIILTVAIIVYSTIRFTVEMKEIYLIEVLLINCCIGGLLVTTPTVAQAIYGQKTGSNIYGFYWEVVATGNFLQYLFVSNLSKTIGFDYIIYICLGMAILAIPIVIFTKFQGPWENETAALQFCVGQVDNKVIDDHPINHSLEAFQEQIQAHKHESVMELSPPKKPAKLQPLEKPTFTKVQTQKIEISNSKSNNDQMTKEQAPKKQEQPEKSDQQLLTVPEVPVLEGSKKSSQLPSSEDTVQIPN